MTEKYHISPEIPASKAERLQPKFLRSGPGNAPIASELSFKQERGLPIKETDGALHPNELKRRDRIGLPPGRFKR